MKTFSSIVRGIAPSVRPLVPPPVRTIVAHTSLNNKTQVKNVQLGKNLDLNL